MMANGGESRNQQVTQPKRMRGCPLAVNLDMGSELTTPYKAVL